MKHKKPSQWEINQNKAEKMCDKFIDILEKMDCFDSWETIIIERVINKLFQDSGLSNKPDYESIMDLLETKFGIRAFRGDSLAEDMKIEEFLNQLRENPYQLKLIA